MSIRTLGSLLALAACSIPTAQAAEVQLGMQGAVTAPLVSPAVAMSGGVHVATAWQLGNSLKSRAVLEANLTSKLAPSVRLDLDVLRGSDDFYYGGGVGSGLIFDMNDGGSSVPAIVLSPVALLNAHGIIGKTFGHSYLEGVVRLGPMTSLGVRYGLYLR